MVENLPTIVVIDNSPTSISLYKLSTMPLAVNLKTFQSPAESLSYLEAHKVELLLLDILMTPMDGLDFLKKLRCMELHQDTSVVMVTSKDYAQDRSTARQLGAREFLVKPLRSQEIRDIICKYTDAQASEGEDHIP